MRGSGGLNLSMPTPDPSIARRHQRNGTPCPVQGLSSVEPAADPAADLARCFLRLANLPNLRARPP